MIRGFFILASAFLFVGASALAGPDRFHLQGQIVQPNGDPLEATSVQFTVQVLSPVPNSCLLYEETFGGVNMAGSKGLFSLAVGTGVRSGADFHDVSSLTSVLNNDGPLVTPTTCESGGPNYAPGSDDQRLLRLTFDDGNGPVTLAQDHTINSVPYSLYAKSLEGLRASDVVKINVGAAAVSQSALETVFATNSDVTALRDLIDGGSGDYVSATPSSSVGFNNQRLTDIDTPVSGGDAANKSYVDSRLGGNTLNTGVLGGGNTGEVLTWNGAQWVSQSLSAAGDVNNGGNAYSGVMTLGTNDNFALNLETNGATALTVDASQGVSLAAGLGVTGGINAGGDVNVLAQSELRFQDTTGGEFIGFRAPAAVTTSRTLTLPDGWGTAGQRLTTNGAGLLDWVTPGTSDHDLLGGLTDDDHTQYSLLAGRSGGQSLVGGLAAGEDLTLDSTSDASKGSVLLAPSGGTVGIGTTAPGSRLQVNGTIRTLSPNIPFVFNETDFGASAGKYWRMPLDGGVLRFDVDTEGDGDFVPYLSPMVLRPTGNIEFTRRVGIGTTSPGSALDVVGDLSLREMTVAPPVSPIDQGRIYFDSTAKKFRVSENNGAYRDLFATSGSGAGDFLANGTIPMTGDLNLNGSSLLGGTGSGGSLNLESTSHATKGAILLNASGGDVGVGTTTPSEKLTVQDGSILVKDEVDAAILFLDGIADGTRSSAVFFRQGGDERLALNVGHSKGIFFNQSNVSQDYVFETALGGDMFVLDGNSAAGNVGIGGDLSPDARLEIVGDGSTPTFLAQDSGDADTTPFVIASSGNVGVGTVAPVGKLQIYGAGGTINDGVILRSTAGGNQFGFYTSLNDFHLRSVTGGNDILTGTFAGRIGVGTTSPETDLDINGNLLVGAKPASGPQLESVIGAQQSENPAEGNSVPGNNLVLRAGVGTGAGANGSISFVTEDTTTVLGNGVPHGPGAPRMTIASSGFVGIGSETPAGPLDVFTTGNQPAITAGSSAIHNFLHMNNSNTGNYVSNQITFDNPSSGMDGIIVSQREGVSDTSYMTFSSNLAGITTQRLQLGRSTNILTAGTAQELILTNGGDLGLGVTPSSKLDLNGDLTMRELASAPAVSAADRGKIYFDGTANKFKVSENGGGYVDLLPSAGVGAGDFLADGSVPATGNLRLNGNYLSGDGGSEGLFVDGAGQVGIGTNAPGAPLEVSGSMRVQNSLVLQRDASSLYLPVLSFADVPGGGRTNNLSLGNNGGSALLLHTNGIERMRIDALGNVGIGTTLPSDRLAIVGGDSQGLSLKSSGRAALSLLPSNSGGTGTNRSFINFTDNSGASSWTIETDTNNDGTNEDLFFFNPDMSGDTSYQLMLAKTGNVGLGAKEPAEKLVVAGSIKADGWHVYKNYVSSGAQNPQVILLAKTTDTNVRINGTLWGFRGHGSSSNTNLEVQVMLSNGSSSNNTAFGLEATGYFQFGEIKAVTCDYAGESWYAISLSPSGAFNYPSFYRFSGYKSEGSELDFQVVNIADVTSLADYDTSTGRVRRDSMVETSFFTGNVGIGVRSPSTALQVDGAITNSAAIANGTTTIDFLTGNLQYTSLSCGAFALHNLKDGGTYSFSVKGLTSGTCSFTAFSGAGTSALTVHMPPGHAASTAGTHTIYSVMVMGTDAYISWVPGY